MNERMAMLTSTSRINLRSCTMPVSRPASISRTATSGSTPGRRSSSQSQSETSSQPRQVEHAVDAYQHVVIRNELPERPCEPRFMPLLAPEHIPPPPTPNH